MHQFDVSRRACTANVVPDYEYKKTIASLKKSRVYENDTKQES